MMRASLEVALQKTCQHVRSFVRVLAERFRRDGEGVGNTVLTSIPVDLGYGVQRSDRAVVVSLVHRICARCERRTCSSAVRRIAGLLTVHDVGSDGQNGQGVYRVSVGRVLAQLLDGSLGDLHCDIVYAVIVVAVFREVAFGSVVHDDAVFVSDRIYLRIFDRGEGVSRNGEARNAECHQTLEFGVQERHLRAFVIISVVHEMNDVHDVDVQLAQPCQIDVETLPCVLKVDRTVADRFHLRTDMLAGSFVNTAV